MTPGMDAMRVIDGNGYRYGRDGFLEARVRRVVVEQLGVGWDDVTPEVSLADDLAADSLDLVELSLGLEDELAVDIPAALFDEVRTYGELVEHLLALDRRPAADDPSLDDALLVSVRIVPGRERTSDLHHTGALTPYLAQTIAEEALRAGPGTRLEVSVPTDVSEEAFRRLEDRLAWMRERDIKLRVRRDARIVPPWAIGAPDFGG